MGPLQRHVIPASRSHNRWNRDLVPVLSADSGDVIEFETKSSDDGQVRKDRPLVPADPSRVHPITGPVFITNAIPGDAIEVQILSVDTADWGWQLVSHDRGLIKGILDQTEVLIVHLDRGRGLVRYPSGAETPLRPFPGIVGVSPDAKGEFRTIEPGLHGGNIDVAELVPGSALMLPVLVPGALLSIGDVHASQGDGEVCLTGVETAGRVTVRVVLHKARHLDRPHLITPSHYGLLATGPTIEAACREAVQAAVSFLVQQSGISQAEAYAICSGSADLRINQVVNGEALGARVMIPLELLNSLGIQPGRTA